MNALPPLITQHLEEVGALCEKYRVKRLSVFGSAVKGTFDEERSDLDFAVEFLPDTPRGGLHGPYFNLLNDLQELFGRDVDLVDQSRIENPYFRQVLELTQQEVYGSTAAA